MQQPHYELQRRPCFPATAFFNTAQIYDEDPSTSRVCAEETCDVSTNTTYGTQLTQDNT
jgi:hypothetical protein